MLVKLKNVTLSFPKLFEAKSVNGSDPKFGANFLFDEGSQAHLDMEAAIKEVANAKWADKIPKGLKTCLQEGDTKEYAGYEGRMFVSSSSAQRPKCVSKGRQPIENEADAPFYAGCLVNALVSVWAQDNQFGKRVNAEIQAVQFAGDGQPLGGRVPVKADDHFDDISEDDWAD